MSERLDQILAVIKDKANSGRNGGVTWENVKELKDAIEEELRNAFEEGVEQSIKAVR